MFLASCRIVVAAVGLSSALGAGWAEAASAPKKFKDWSLYEHQDDNGKTCFITTTAIKQEGVKIQRDPPRLFVTRFPASPPNEQVMIDLGYRYKVDAVATLGIDTKVFNLLLAKDNKAWTKTPEDDAALVAAMKRGSEAVVKGVSSIGTNPIDTYSLAGFAAAYDALGQVCKNAGKR